MRSVPFIKVHGLGNDYVLYDLIACGGDVPLEAMEPEGVRRVCDRRRGVGADGVLILDDDQARDARLWIINSDGSPGGVCGTGIRCAATHLVRHHAVPAGTPIRLVVGDKGRERVVEAVVTQEKDGWQARVDMGVVDFAVQSLPADGTRLKAVGVMHSIVLRGDGLPEYVTGVLVSVGNPHLVCVLDDANVGLAKEQVGAVGLALSEHPAFPEGVNVHLVSRGMAMEDGTPILRVATSERGSGVVLACTTGACAVVAACTRLGLIEERGVVESAGGRMAVDYDPETGRVFAEGEAVEVCQGVWLV